MKTYKEIFSESNLRWYAYDIKGKFLGLVQGAKSKNDALTKAKKQLGGTVSLVNTIQPDNY